MKPLPSALLRVAKALPGDLRGHALAQVADLRRRLVAEPPLWLLAALRRLRPRLVLGPIELRTRASEVRSTLEDANAYPVTPYGRVMTELVGPFPLGQDGEPHTAGRACLESILGTDAEAASLPGSESRSQSGSVSGSQSDSEAPSQSLEAWADRTARAMVAEAIAAGIPTDRLAGDVASRYPAEWAVHAGLVPAHTDPSALATAATRLFAACFGNLAGDRGVDRRGRAAAADLGALGLDAARIGLVVGAVPTVAEAVGNVVAELDAHPERWDAVLVATRAGDRDEVWRHARECLRFRPQAPVLARGRADGDGLVLASTLSAMHDSAAVADPALYLTERPESAYLHFGHGSHRCAGERIAVVLIVSMVGALAEGRLTG